jgi:hypothetical protein
MRIAIIGGGLFGCTAALYASRAGHDVKIFEKNSRIMMGASLVNFARLHRGAHYPRSADTGQECRAAEQSFRWEYGSCVIEDGTQSYIIPSYDSHVTPDQFAKFLSSENLRFHRDGDRFYVLEPRVNLSYLQAVVYEKLKHQGVQVNYGGYPVHHLLDEFDKIIVAAYSDTNDVMEQLGRPVCEYKFQVVEKIISLLPESFRNTSIVVADGPFGCIDPMDDTPLHLIGHVTHTIHASNVGTRSVIPWHLNSYINVGTIYNAEITKHSTVIESLAEHIEGLSGIYAGSQYTVRAVLAGEEATDRRPTLVEAVDDKVIKVFSGKLGTACVAAEKVMNLIGY